MNKISRFLKTWPVWKRLRPLARELSDRELAEAEALERLGRRRPNVLRVLHAERQCREGRGKKMQRLRVEARL